MNSQLIVAYLPALMICVFIAAQIFTQWRSGTGKGQKEAVANWKEIADSYAAKLEQREVEHKEEMQRITAEYKHEVQQLRLDISKHTSEIGNLRGIIEEKNKQLKDYLAIFQERDPESKKVVEFVEKVQADIEKFHNDNVIMKTDIQQVKDQVGAIHQFLLAKTIPAVAVPPGTPQNPTAV